MFYLLETPVGVALFRKTEDVAIVDKMLYTSSTEAAEACGSPALPAAVDDFLMKHLPAAAELRVLSPPLAAVLSERYRAVSGPDATFRRIRTNAFKWFGIGRDAYNAVALRVAQRLAGSSPEDARLVETFVAAEELERGITSRTARIREWYSLHFPELNCVADDAEYLRLVLLIGDRRRFLAGDRHSTPENGDTDNPAVPQHILELVGNSMGVDISGRDMEKIEHSVSNIQRDTGHRNSLLSLMKEKCKTFFPNLHGLIGEVVLARLLQRCGSLARLSQLPSSTIQILGAEKAFNEAVREKGNTPKFGIIFACKAVSRASHGCGGHVARVLANKIALCARVDVAGECPDGGFGTKARAAIDTLSRRLEDRDGAGKRPVKQQKRVHISVKEYDQERDARKKSKNNK